MFPTAARCQSVSLSVSSVSSVSLPGCHLAGLTSGERYAGQETDLTAVLSTARRDCGGLWSRPGRLASRLIKSYQAAVAYK